MLSAARIVTGTDGPADELFVGPKVTVEGEVAARRSPDDGTEGCADELFVEPTSKFNGRAETGTEGSADELFVEPTATGCCLRFANISNNSVRRLNELIGNGMRRCGQNATSATPISQVTGDVGFRFDFTLYCIRAMGHLMLVTVLE